MRCCRFVLSLVLGLLGSFVSASEPTAEATKFFEMKVRPLLAEHCWKCHGEDASKGGLRLDSLASVLQGGESGAAIEPGNVDESLLIQAVRHESYEMPPSKKLSDDEIAVFEAWVKLGAPWPGADPSKINPVRQEAQLTPEEQNWWAIQPLSSVSPPANGPSDWARNGIDQFIAASLSSQELSPAPEAERSALIRRVYFDLIGLPPSPDDVKAFTQDRSPDAYEKLVDKLLASPEYGKRWARHWLDLVRYADSDGYRIDHYRPHAWRYRDYVIESLNDDKPYDRFVQEQLAGDELFPQETQARIATGFLTHGIYEYNNRDAVGHWDIMLNELTDTTSDVFLGLGLQCARCHDHKFDPLLQKDYYRLRAFFEPIELRTDETVATDEQLSAYKAALAGWEAKTKSIREQIDTLEAPYRVKATNKAINMFPEDIQQMVRKPAEEKTPYEKQLTSLIWRQVEYEYTRLAFMPKDKETVFALRKELSAFEKDKPADLPVAQVACDIENKAPATTIPKRKTVVQPGYPTLIAPEDALVPALDSNLNSTGRRAALAKWITQPDNPLTTRVIVNRIWQYHFGRGLAPNASDFGMLGGPPTHPELLDWLTHQFVDGGWKFKPLHRLIVTSATYRQSTSHPKSDVYMTLDPRNVWYWRAETRRLDAEQIRDAILAVTGELESSNGGPGVEADRPRRSIYTRVMRNTSDPLLEVFDLPLFFASTSSRMTTTSPIQSLQLINSQSMLRAAGKLSSRIAAMKSVASKNADQQAIEQLWSLVYGRDPSQNELAIAQEFIQAQRQVLDQKPPQADSTSLKTGKLPYRDGTSILITPGDQHRYSVASKPRLNTSDFTIEVFFQVRSIYASGDVRTIVSKWDGDESSPGWTIGVTGKGSRRKPQTIALIVVGKNVEGQVVEEVLFSDQSIELNKPYYLAASVSMANGKPGQVTFSLKDLSNDDEQMQSVTLEHQIASGHDNTLPLMLGGRQGKRGAHQFDGLIDDVRLSNRALSRSELYFVQETQLASTIGHWRFESDPGLLKDSSRYEHDLSSDAASRSPLAASQAALTDLCHVLLNSSEFLYVH